MTGSRNNFFLLDHFSYFKYIVIFLQNCTADLQQRKTLLIVGHEVRKSSTIENDTKLPYKLCIMQ